MFQFIRKVDLCITDKLIRVGWYRYRKELGYPITLRRALFSPMPRFGHFEAHETGCPSYHKINYALVRSNKDKDNV